MTGNTPSAVCGLGAIIPRYDVVLCDLWGVMHNGVAVFPGALDAVRRARASGASVIMLSNAPRPGPIVAKQIANYGVPADSYDDVIASGDVTRSELMRRPGAKVFHLGPERDLPNYEGLDLTLVDFDKADLVVVTGPFHDEHDKPEDYRDLLNRAKARNLTVICANPDIVVERGDKLLWCAGAIAAIYDEIGGETIYAGKPYPEIYKLALARAAKLHGHEIPAKRVVAIGDGLKTDILGAAKQGFDSIFIARGIHAADFSGPDGVHDAALLEKIFSEAGATPTGVMRELIW
jgi:HAD superfamily hydrolase (TIGR01459 family)